MFSGTLSRFKGIRSAEIVPKFSGVTDAVYRRDGRRLPSTIRDDAKRLREPRRIPTRSFSVVSLLLLRDRRSNLALVCRWTVSVASRRRGGCRREVVRLPTGVASSTLIVGNAPSVLRHRIDRPPAEFAAVVAPRSFAPISETARLAQQQMKQRGAICRVSC